MMAPLPLTLLALVGVLMTWLGLEINAWLALTSDALAGLS